MPVTRWHVFKMSFIQTLPIELLECEIAKYLDYKSIFNLGKTCKWFADNWKLFVSELPVTIESFCNDK